MSLIRERSLCRTASQSRSAPFSSSPCRTIFIRKYRWFLERYRIVTRALLALQEDVMDLARANARLKRLHDLPASVYQSPADLALAYLRAGCEMFGFHAAALRGDENIVYDPEGIFQTPAPRLQIRSLNGHGQMVFAG